MINWIISLLVAGVAIVLALHANGKFGTQRQDGRAHRMPWGLVLIACAFVLVLVIVRIANLLGIDTGPGNGLFG